MPAFQNQGIGTKLIEQLKQEAVAQARPLLISVEKDNPHARRLYERVGCTLIAEDENEYHLGYNIADRTTAQQ
jgi:ribosomal protein S18 acetylase RimI-like enzyme